VRFQAPSSSTSLSLPDHLYHVSRFHRLRCLRLTRLNQYPHICHPSYLSHCSASPSCLCPHFPVVFSTTPHSPCHLPVLYPFPAHLLLGYLLAFIIFLSRSACVSPQDDNKNTLIVFLAIKMAIIWYYWPLSVVSWLLHAIPPQRARHCKHLYTSNVL